MVAWGGPAALMLLALLVVVPVLGAVKPGQWLRAQFSSGLNMAANLGEQLEPEVVIVMTPIVEGAAESVTVVTAAEPQPVAMAVKEAPIELPAATPAEAASLAVVLPTPTLAATDVSAATPETDAAVVLPTPPDIPTATPVVTATPVPTSSPTPTTAATPAAVVSGAGIAAQVEQTPAALSPTPTWTPLPTAAGMAALLPTPTPATGIGGAVGTIAVAAVAPDTTDEPTPSPTPQVHQVKAGDTLVTIAARYGVDVEAIMAANGIAASEVYVIQPGQLLIIPELVETPTPAATTEPQLYQVRPGDTLVSIAAQYGVATSALMAANGIAAQDVYVLQPGEVLTIPGTASAPAPSTATPTVAAVPATATAMPTEAGGAVRLDAPVLISPESGTPMSCSGQSTLVWERVQFMRDDDKYVLHLGFVSGRQDNGEDVVTWVLAQPRPATQSSWDLDASLCGLASQAFGRQWRWWVEVVAEADGGATPVSPPSLVWGFSWN